MKNDIGKKFERLIEIMARLRAPNGCPWDREQTPDSITPYLLEETYETIEAITSGDKAHVREELGDLLLQVVFQSQMANEAGDFDVGGVIDSISEKLIRRHPHVFGDTKVKGSKDVLTNWEHIKKSEGKKSLLGGVPETLPALLKAYRLGEKASRVGFDWNNAEGVLEKIEEEARELHEAKKGGIKKDIEHEYGDLLLILANLGRFLKIDPETALRKATNRFIRRFQCMEETAAGRKLDLKKLDIEKLEELWQEAKKRLSLQA
jgi:tetrapyrrole methylase family protein/MazG family protein